MFKNLTLALTLCFVAACGGTANLPDVSTPDASMSTPDGGTETVEAGLCNSGCSTAPQSGVYTVSEVSTTWAYCTNPPWAVPPPDLYLNIFPTTISITKPCSVTDLNNLADTLMGEITGNDYCNPPSHLDQSACVVNDAILCQAAPHDPTIHDHFSATIQYTSSTTIYVSYVDQAYQPTDGSNQCARATNVTWTWQHK